ncbi:hypothetical protein CDAR_622131 [Caerostris darwini]|uniref:Uncharacterized protein n=1 Tax=Caerostris darwini TaxID=1538125 RepID=A0AAV4RYG2_9ARAC|nr:hypothetical protein CDAR_622131 [Caerostris darwini]
MTDTSPSWLIKQPLTDTGFSVVAEISRPHDTLTQLSPDFWSRTRQGKRKKEKKTHSLSHPHTEKSPGRIKPIKSNCIQKTTGVK